MRTLLRHKADFAAIHRKMKAIVDDADANHRGVLTADAALELDHLKQRRVEVEEAIERRKLLLAEDDALTQRDDGGHTATYMGFPLGDPNDPSAPTRGSAGSVARDDSGGFASLADVFSALRRRQLGYGVDPRLGALAVSAASGIHETGPSSGGFLIPDVLLAARLYSPSIDTPLLNLSDRFAMTSAKASVPIIRDTAHTTSPFGLSWAVVPEDGTISETIPDFGKVNLVARKVAALARISNEWMDDTSAESRSRVEEAFVRSLRWTLEKLAWRGDGASEPLGCLNSAGTVEVAAEAGQSDNTILVENVYKLWSRLLPGSHANAIWAINQTALPQLLGLVQAVGTGGSNVGLVRDRSIAGEPPMQIFGRPLFTVEHLPALGYRGDICVVDPAYILWGDRKMTTLDFSGHAAFSTDQTMLRAQWRGDIAPVLSSTFTPANGDALGFCAVIADRLP